MLHSHLIKTQTMIENEDLKSIRKAQDPKNLAEINRQLQEANKKLLEANQFKTEFVANMSHELRSPLNDILGFTQLLLARTYGEVNPRQDEAIQLVSDSAHTLLHLINSILDISKLGSGDVECFPEEFAVGELVEEVLKGCSALVRGKPIKIRKDLEADLIPIRCDRGKLKQIITNLVHNAIKFTQRGSIKVSTKGIPQQRKIEIAVEDTGIGIDKKNAEIIFDAFRQVDGSSTRAFGGSGLGLAITKKLLDLLHGEITLKSSPGLGSTFRVILPLDMLDMDDHDHR